MKACCVLDEDGWETRAGGGEGEGGPRGQEVVDESGVGVGVLLGGWRGGGDWWARTVQGRSKRTATEMTSETKL